MTRAPSGQGPAAHAARVIAHRGASRHAPGNSIAAFQRAIDLGAAMVELDVRRTADDFLIVQHNARHRGQPISRWRYADLFARPRKEGRRMGRLVGGAPPLLEHVLQLCAGRIDLDIELKDPGDEADVFALAFRHLEPGAFVVTSFHDAVVATCKLLQPEVRAGLLVSSAPQREANPLPGTALLDRARACGADFIAPNQLLVIERFMERAADRGLPVIPWTVNRPKRLGRLLRDPRIEGVITDVPDLALDLLRGGPPRPDRRRPPQAPVSRL